MNIGTTVVKARRSVRSYTDVPVSDEIIKDIIECARLAPTANNKQPWLIGIVKDSAKLKQIADFTGHGKFIGDSKVCFVVFCLKDEKYYLEDGCACTMNIITSLQAYGIGSCWVAGDKKEYADDIRKLLNAPDKYTLVSLIPAGYPKEFKKPQKKQVKEISFVDVWSEQN